MPEASFASLNPTLLARKGGAKPAMRPHVGVVPGMAVAGNVAQNFDDLDDLGWNDMGHDHEAREGGVVHLTPAPANEETAGEAAANDLGAQAELADPSVKPVVRKQQEAISEKLAEPPKQPEPVAPPAASTAVEAVLVAAEPKKTIRKRKSTPKTTAKNGYRTAFTLRLDAERHLKLRLASTIRGRSAQVLVTEALDALLAGMEDLDSLVAQVQQGPSQTTLITGMKEGTEA